MVCGRRVDPISRSCVCRKAHLNVAEIKRMVADRTLPSFVPEGPAGSPTHLRRFRPRRSELHPGARRDHRPRLRPAQSRSSTRLTPTLILGPQSNVRWCRQRVERGAVRLV